MVVSIGSTYIIVSEIGAVSNNMDRLGVFNQERRGNHSDCHWIMQNDGTHSEERTMNDLIRKLVEVYNFHSFFPD